MPRQPITSDPAQVRRIVEAFRSASAADLADGLDWYDRASDLADALAAGTGFSKHQTAGVIAALSPRVGWDLNVVGATAMVRAASKGRRTAPVVAGLGENRAKAWRILRENVADPLDVLGGPKVRRFFRNITGDLDAVTVDVWAARAAGFAGKSLTDRQYLILERSYQEAADMLGHAPRDVQAAVWVYIRRTWKEQA